MAVTENMTAELKVSATEREARTVALRHRGLHVRARS